METTPQITFRGLEARPDITKIIEEKLAKLEEVSDRITSARVTVEMRSGKGNKGQLYQVAVELEVPGGTVIVNHKPGDLGAHEDLRVAVRDSFNAARRQLREHGERLDDQQVRPHPERRHGTVVRLFPDEGYGFIENAEREDVFFDRDSVTHNGWKDLDIYSEVAFTQNEGDKGLFAGNVTLVSRPGV